MLNNENQLHKERETQFKANLNQQQQLFAEAKAELEAQQQLSATLQSSFDCKRNPIN